MAKAGEQSLRAERVSRCGITAVHESTRSATPRAKVEQPNSQEVTPTLQRNVVAEHAAIPLLLEIVGRASQPHRPLNLATKDKEALRRRVHKHLVVEAVRAGIVRQHTSRAPAETQTYSNFGPPSPAVSSLNRSHLPRPGPTAL